MQANGKVNFHFASDCIRTTPTSTPANLQLVNLKAIGSRSSRVKSLLLVFNHFNLSAQIKVHATLTRLKDFFIEQLQLPHHHIDGEGNRFKNPGIVGMVREFFREGEYEK